MQRVCARLGFKYWGTPTIIQVYKARIYVAAEEQCPADR